ncbi:transposon, En/Spm-like, transposase-associated domain protein, partial [Tanacetum coccineum]
MVVTTSQLVTMPTRKDREWMYNKADDGYLSKTYRTIVESFLDYAFSNEEYVDKDRLTLDYTSWWAHGETASRFQHEGQSSTPMEDNDVDGCTQMVMDAMVPTIFNSASFEPNSNLNPSNEQAPNPSTKGFYDMLAAAYEPLWDGCQNYSKLQIVLELLNWKSENNVSKAAYNRLIPIIKKSLPPSEKLVKNFYETKKSLKTLALPEKKIHAYKNHCMLFYGKKSPGQNIDVFLRPLIDELITLYNEGIETYDVARKENFIMKAALLWTVSDFPAYAMLSGWSTHGKLAVPNVNGGEKNVFENLFNTVMGTTKMKDNVKARKDVKKYCNQVELHIRQVGTKDMKPKASYTLTKPQV